MSIITIQNQKFNKLCTEFIQLRSQTDKILDQCTNMFPNFYLSQDQIAKKISIKLFSDINHLIEQIIKELSSKVELFLESYKNIISYHNNNGNQQNEEQFQQIPNVKKLKINSEINYQEKIIEQITYTKRKHDGNNLDKLPLFDEINQQLHQPLIENDEQQYQLQSFQISDDDLFSTDNYRKYFEKNKDGIEVCQLCQKQVGGYSNLSKHWTLNHSKTSLQCLNCQQTFNSYKNLYFHNYLRHNDQLKDLKQQFGNYYCEFCQQVQLNSNTSLKAHIQSAHSQEFIKAVMEFKSQYNQELKEKQKLQYRIQQQQ